MTFLFNVAARIILLLFKSDLFLLKAEGATLELRRQLPVQEPTLELVTLVCCVSLTPGVQVLHSRKLTLSVVASLQPYISYNQSELIREYSISFYNYLLFILIWYSV